MKILITDFYCASNRGDAAILLGMRELLLRHFPSPSIKVLAYKPESVRCITGMDAAKPLAACLDSPRKSLGAAALLASARSGALRHALPHLPPALRERVRDYEEADLVLSAGGSFLNDFYARELRARLFGLRFAQALGKPTAIFAQSIGPFRRPASRREAVRALSGAVAVIVREPASARYLQEIGFRHPRLSVGADAAFSMNTALSPLEVFRLERKLASEGFVEEPAQEWVSLSARRWQHRPEAFRGYCDALTAWMDWIIERGARVALLSTCTGFDGYYNDDRVLAHRLRERLRRPEQAVVFNNEYSPAELAWVYGKMRVHVGTRMHSCILAALGGTPFIPIGYEIKSSGLAEQLGLESLLLDYAAVDEAALRGAYLRLSGALADYSERLKHGVEALRRQAEQSAALLQSLLTGTEQERASHESPLRAERVPQTI